MTKKVNNATSRPQKRYCLPKNYSVEFGVMEDVLDYMVPCPKCDKRTMDVSSLPERPIRLKHKCPHCNNIVVTPLIAADKVDKLCVKRLPTKSADNHHKG